MENVSFEEFVVNLRAFSFFQTTFKQGWRLEFHTAGALLEICKGYNYTPRCLR